MNVGPVQPSGGAPHAAAPARWVRANAAPNARADPAESAPPATRASSMKPGPTSRTSTTRAPSATSPSQRRPAASASKNPVGASSRCFRTLTRSTVGWLVVLILLPPSESKRTGGDGAPLDLESLGFPGLNPLRRELLAEVAALAADLPAARAALGVGPAQDPEIAADAALLTSPTLPALDRYTGVLYDRLGVASLTRAQRSRAEARLIIGSALFGATRATDRLPAYRLSANSKLPGRPGLTTRWRPLLGPALSTGELTLDLRSGAYAALGPVPGAVSVEVVTSAPTAAARWSRTSARRPRATWPGCCVSRVLSSTQ